MLSEAIQRLWVDDLLVLDRGFPCRWLAAALTARGIPSRIRRDISRGFRVVRQFMLSGQSEQLVTLGFRSFRVEPTSVSRMPLPSPAGAPTPGPAPEGGEVLAAGRARALAAKSLNQPQAIEGIGISGALKGTLRRAWPALDRVINAGKTAAPGCRAPRLAATAGGRFHAKRYTA
jgi:hypothetical protein